MPRKKSTSNSSITVPESVLQKADQAASDVENVFLDRVEARLNDFFLGGGFVNELGSRLIPIFEQFSQGAGIAGSSEPNSVHLLGGDSPTVEVTASDV